MSRIFSSSRRKHFLPTVSRMANTVRRLSCVKAFTCSDAGSLAKQVNDLIRLFWRNTQIIQWTLWNIRKSFAALGAAISLKPFVEAEFGNYGTTVVTRQTCLSAWDWLSCHCICKDMQRNVANPTLLLRSIRCFLTPLELCFRFTVSPGRARQRWLMRPTKTQPNPPGQATMPTGRECSVGTLVSHS